MHAENKHEIELYSDTLLDFKETDTFIRFFRSIRMGNEYIAKRIHLYPEHWNHIEIEGRIKFRMLAKRKLEICSRHIEDNMREKDAKNMSLKIKSYAWAET